MIFSRARRLRIFVYHQAIDMRCGYERLLHFVREEMKHDVLDGHMFLFLGRNRKRAKVLLFDKTGLLLISKKLLGGHIMAVEDLSSVNEIKIDDLEMILSGAHIYFS